MARRFSRTDGGFAITGLQDLQQIISSRGVRHSSLDRMLTQLEETITALLALESNEASELAGIIWRLRCSLAQLKQAVPE
ncbi:Uncharacterised protein [Pantoea agglomerans]|uniref:Uncharacterized protein n=1 Tax=Enterobacter agglomerans TaxID=549 RepID=A0A379AGK3_ENTAG|nr:Uncharacterised protein [Pantoea agglomerans]